MISITLYDRDLGNKWQDEGFRKSFFQKRRRSEKSGLVKVAAAVEIMNEIQLKPVIESKEDSTVELAEELAEISFDAAHVSTPLQVIIPPVIFDTKIH